MLQRQFEWRGSICPLLGHQGSGRYYHWVLTPEAAPLCGFRPGHRTWHRAMWWATQSLHVSEQKGLSLEGDNIRYSFTAQ